MSITDDTIKIGGKKNLLYAMKGSSSRVKPQKDIKAFCPLCKSPVIPVCGDIYIDHWRHNNSYCSDSWYEPETEWHREWKEQFHKDWQEVIIEKNGIKHRADIQTDTGLVLELQNSSISSTTIKEREAFYKEMIWVINAETFKRNFDIFSIVSKNLKMLDLTSEYFYGSSDDKYESEKKEIKALEQSIKSKYDEIGFILHQIEECEDNLENIGDYANKVIEDLYNIALNDFKSELLSNIHKTNTIINEIEVFSADLEKHIKSINNLPDYKQEPYSGYKIINLSQVSPKSYLRCVVIKKKSLDSLFPVVMKIHSKLDFERYKFHKDEYILAIDLSKSVEAYKTSIAENQKLLQHYTYQNKINVVSLKNALQNWLKHKIVIYQQQLERLEAEIKSMIETFNAEEAKLRNQVEHDIKVEIIKASERKRQEKQREIEIKKRYKGLYSYEWKYKRRTWDFARCQIYFDFGEHLFKMLPNETFRKITKEEFILMVLNT